MKEQEIKKELQYYSERYYAQALDEAGFVNYRGNLLNWYNIYNGVICHFHITCFDSRFPMLMLIWWIHPTYLPAILNPPAAWNRFGEYMRFSAVTSLYRANTIEPGHFLNVPMLPQHGAERLEEQLFPQIRKLNTREAVYYAKRNAIITRWEELAPDTPRYNLVTPEFADAALIMNDAEMFPYCIDRLEQLAIPASHRFPPKNGSIVGRSTELLEAQLKALKGVEVEGYFELMKVRKAKFMKRYKLQDDYEL